MSTRTAPARRSAPASPRRLGWLLFAALAVVGAFVVLSSPVDKVVRELRLPLRHEDVIRQQAADKGVDAALIAAVIYAESHFRDQTSVAGARGLMQITPPTAEYIAQLSGGTAFEQGDLASPQINIAYGTYYLNYLLEKYERNELLALAAYNAGEGRVDGWLDGALASGEAFAVADHVPFAETEAYVTKVLEAREEYRRRYARELGL